MPEAGALTDDTVQLLQCPGSKSSLRRSGNGELISSESGSRYPVRDGIISFEPDVVAPDTADPAKSVREYYEKEGWTSDADGIFADTRAFVDLRKAPLDYTHKCMARLNKYFREGGEQLLDVGSGPIPHREYLTYGERFARRICVDLSIPALRIARSKLGDRGVFIRGDMTNLPIRSASIDAVTCNHVMYHIPADKQATAFREIWRVLKPGGVGVVVYAWQWSPIAGRLAKVGSFFTGSKPDVKSGQPDIYYHAHSLKWFRSQEWPFRYRIDTFRIVDENFMKRYIPDGLTGRAILQCFYAAQLLFPSFCGKYGAFPAIVIYKD